MGLLRDWPSGTEQGARYDRDKVIKPADNKRVTKFVTDVSCGIGSSPLRNRVSSCVHQKPTSHLNNVNGSAVFALVNVARDKHTHTLFYTTRTRPKNRDPIKHQDTKK